MKRCKRHDLDYERDQCPKCCLHKVAIFGDEGKPCCHACGIALGWVQASQLSEALLALRAAQSEIAELRAAAGDAQMDSERLDWLNATEAVIAHSQDGDSCHLMWPYRDEDEQRVQDGIFNSYREAIDAARAKEKP